MTNIALYPQSYPNINRMYDSGDEGHTRGHLDYFTDALNNMAKEAETKIEKFSILAELDLLHLKAKNLSCEHFSLVGDSFTHYDDSIALKSIMDIYPGFNLYWNDPEDGLASDFCKIVSFPYDNCTEEEKKGLLEELEIKGYELIVASEYYNHNNDGLEYGIQIGSYSIYRENIEIYDMCWFITEEEREAFIKRELVKNYINTEDIAENNPFVYNDDDIFLIHTAHRSEVEIWNTELEKIY